jgi:hypothetical protein
LVEEEQTMSMTHREKRVYFTRLACELILWINKEDWTAKLAEAGEGSLDTPSHVECAVDEWTVMSPRPVKVGTEFVLAQDRRHNPNGLHPAGLAVDLLIYINGVYLTNGAHPIWVHINKKARAMDPEFGLGLSFNDANHLSLGE